MWKKILIISQCILILSTSCINVYATTENQDITLNQETLSKEKEYITPEEYFRLFIKEFFPNEEFENEYKTGYTSGPIQFLIKRNIIEPIHYCGWEKGYYSLSTFIDTSLLLMGYYDRPTEYYDYTKRIETILTDYGINLKEYNLEEKITKEEALEIINILKNTKFNNIKNKYLKELPVKYTINDYINKEKDVRQFISFIENLKPSIIKFLNENKYKFVITNNITKNLDIDTKKLVSGCVVVNTKEIYIQEYYQSTLPHEIAHAIHLELIPDIYLNKLYKLEGNIEYPEYPKASYAEEYFVRSFEEIYNDCYLKNKEKKIQYYKKNHPITFEIIYEYILEPEEINYNKIKEILKTKLS